jgi:hypothetical protein
MWHAQAAEDGFGSLGVPETFVPVTVFLIRIDLIGFCCLTSVYGA